MQNNSLRWNNLRLRAFVIYVFLKTEQTFFKKYLNKKNMHAASKLLSYQPMMEL